jgi:hypothetical protein
MSGLPARFNTPFRSLFFCGGVRGNGAARPTSLRDYLYRKRGIRFNANIVFAEDANQLYRDTNYSDLISFEEDIARIVSSVLVIVESPGSFAELGAFAMNETIRSSMRVVVQSRFAEQESFIRFGPIQKLRNEDPESVAFYPWETRRGGGVVVSSINSHYSEIKNFITKGINSAPKSHQFHSEPDVKKFFIVYWVLYHSYASSLSVLKWAVNKIDPSINTNQLKDCLYCLRIVGWIGKETYSNKDYYFALSSVDPVSYNYPRNNPAGRNMLARQMAIKDEFRVREKIPKHISNVVKNRREAAK